MSINDESYFFQNIRRGIAKKIISFSSDRSKITYHCSRDFKTNFNNPEEKIRASYFTELVLDYLYPAKKIDMEVVVPRRTPSDRADIVIFEDDALTKPFLVVECKKDGITDEEYKQAIEQAFGNANSLRSKYASAVAGITKTAFDVANFNPRERERNVISDIPRKYGKAPKFRFVKGKKYSDLKIISRAELIQTLKKSHDTVWQGGALSPTVAFDEVSKILFCKLKDEKETKNGEKYKFQIGTHETSEEVSERIKKIYKIARDDDPEIFKDEITLGSKILYQLVEHLQELHIDKIDLDTKGIAFEIFMQDFFKGKNGQYFTPRNIVKFCIDIIDPKLNDLVLDPACGSGGFLLYSLAHVRNFAEKNYDEKEAWQHWHNFAMNHLYGIEINAEIARVCKMNMILHDDGHTNVIRSDALSKFENILSIHKKFKKNSFDLIITNPPFGASVKNKEIDYMRDYEFGKNKKGKIRKTQKTEIMFIERCIDYVKPGTGRIAIVLPDGVLTNSTIQYVRNSLIEKCQILAIVSLPNFAFTHYGAGVKSSVVFLRRKSTDDKKLDYPIFMGIAEHIGYDSTGRIDSLNDLDDITKEFEKFKTNPSNYKGK